MTVDIAIHDAFVLTVDDRNRLYERGTVLIEDGRITDVRSSRDDDADVAAGRVIDGDGKLVMPGLANAHTHLELTPLLGAFSDLDLAEMVSTMTAIFGRIADGDYEYLTEAGYEFAALNFLIGGVTTVNSMDIRPGAGTETFGEVGLRGFFGPALSDLFWDVPVDEQFARARGFIDEHHGASDGSVRATIDSHDDWSCTRDLWERTAALVDEHPDLLVHNHLLDLLDDVGLLDDRLVAAHFRLADDEDVRRTAEAGASVAHCPSIFCYWNTDGDVQWTPVPDLRDAGVDVGLGIDDHYWHDSYDMFGEARQARFAANLKRSTGQCGSMELVRMLTIEGAAALGVGDETGSLEPGKRADVILIDVDKSKFTPLTNVPAQVANNAAPADVETVIVDGDVLVADGEVKTMDPAAVRDRVETAVERFESETDWELGVGGSERPSTLNVARDVPKRGPAQLLGRLAFQSIRDRFPF